MLIEIWFPLIIIVSALGSNSFFHHPFRRWWDRAFLTRAFELGHIQKPVIYQLLTCIILNIKYGRVAVNVKPFFACETLQICLLSLVPQFQIHSDWDFCSQWRRLKKWLIYKWSHWRLIILKHNCIIFGSRLMFSKSLTFGNSIEG